MLYTYRIDYETKEFLRGVRFIKATDIVAAAKLAWLDREVWIIGIKQED